MNNKYKKRDYICYKIASASTRIFSKIIDFIIVDFFIFVFGLIIFVTDKSFNWSKPFILNDSWRYSVFGLIVVITNTILLFILPSFFNHQTIGKMIFKIRFYNSLPFSSLKFNLFKHELLTWEINTFFSMLLCFLLTFIDNSEKNEAIFNGLLYFFQKNNNILNVYFYIGIFFSTIYYVNLILIIIYIINLIYNSSHPSFIDEITNLLVISSKGSFTDKNNNNNLNQTKNNNKINYGLPGEIGSGIHEEIDTF